LTKLIEAANRVCDQGERQPQLVVLRGAFHRQPPQIPHSGAEGEGVNPAKSLKLLVAEGRYHRTHCRAEHLYQLNWAG
jgi:hypothetical protein